MSGAALTTEPFSTAQASVVHQPLILSPALPLILINVPFPANE